MRSEHSAFGPWERCVSVVFFQHAFTKVAPTDNATQPGSFHMMEHFVAYVKGAADIA